MNALPAFEEFEPGPPKRSGAGDGQDPERHEPWTDPSDPSTQGSMLTVTPTPGLPSGKQPARSADGLLRMVYDCRTGEDGVELVRGEGDGPSGDPTVDDAYENLGAVWRLYKECYGRDSIDDNGTPLVAFVHYKDGYNNANWNGEYMVYGDGSEGAGLHNLTELTITGHELTHGIVQETLNLDTRGEAGTLNEHLADVFGSLAKQYQHKQTAKQADWLIAEGINRDPRKGPALRSLKDPKSFDVTAESPDHVDGYVHSLRSNYAVHVNVGIPNKAFYLVATKLGGHAYDDAGQIWYHAMTTAQLRSNCRFHHFAEATIDSATQLYGQNSKQVKAVIDAWVKVGVLRPDKGNELKRVARLGVQNLKGLASGISLPRSAGQTPTEPKSSIKDQALGGVADITSISQRRDRPVQSSTGGIVNERELRPAALTGESLVAGSRRKGSEHGR